MGQEIDWYDRRGELEAGQVFRDYAGDLVKLDRRVPCDGTQWYVATWYPGYTQNGHTVKPGWCYEDSIIEPGDLRGDPLPDPADLDRNEAAHAANSLSRLIFGQVIG